MKIFDCVPFFSEFEVLRLRMAYLEDVVDRFVVVEAHQTHAGKPKPLHLSGAEGAELRRHPKLTARAVDLPVGGSDWARDQFQRDSLGEALRELGAAPEDLVLISDVDEIPAVAALHKARDALAAAKQCTILAFEQRMFYFRLNYELVWSRKLPWIGTAAARYEHVASVNGVRTTARNIRGRHAQGFDAKARVLRVPEGGWHFSYIGDDAALEQKLGAHEEHGRKRRDGGSIRELIAGRRSLFPRGGLEEVWAVMPPEAVGLPGPVVARAGVGHLFEKDPDASDDILRRVREAAVPRRWRLGRYDLGYARRSPWPRLGEE